MNTDGTPSTPCVCGNGNASPYDNLCRFCREDLLSRADGKKVNVRHKGDGMSITQYRVAIGELDRKDVYI